MRIEHHAFGEPFAGIPAPHQPETGGGPITSRLVFHVGRFPVVIRTGLTPPSPNDGRFVKSPLDVALDEFAHTRWTGMRTYATAVCQTRKAIETVQAIAGRDIRPADVTTAQVKQAVTIWRQTVKPVTINQRLVWLACMGVNVQGCRVRSPRKLKWWLSPKDEVVFVAKLRETRRPNMLLLADYVEWTTRTGLRVEESLGLTWADVHFGELRTLITVPGLKTHGSQATLPVSAEAATILQRRKAEASTSLVFDVRYIHLGAWWREARKLLDIADPAVATLKALRRSAARQLTMKGMPLAILKDYLRHEKVDTTMGYLRLTGGYGEHEMAKWL